MKKRLDLVNIEESLERRGMVPPELRLVSVFIATFDESLPRNGLLGAALRGFIVRLKTYRYWIQKFSKFRFQKLLRIRLGKCTRRQQYLPTGTVPRYRTVPYLPYPIPIGISSRRMSELRIHRYIINIVLNIKQFTQNLSHLNWLCLGNFHFRRKKICCLKKKKLLER